MNFNNPFSIDRAEQLGSELFKFFATHKKMEGLLQKKSLVVQGGRGSGKTMFFLYNTYKSRKIESQAKDIAFDDFLTDLEAIGIHFRCDSNFVPGFQLKGLQEDEWSSLFGHYLNLALSKSMVEIIIDINKSIKKITAIPFSIGDEIEGIFGATVVDFEQLLALLKREEIKVINFVNNVGRFEKPVLTANGFLLNLISKCVLLENTFEKKTIHIFIDEYENLLDYQQVLINTLIKHPAPVVFNIGARNEGIRTYLTLAKSESISAPHDFNPFSFEDFTKEEYEELINEVCKKRLQTIPQLAREESTSELLSIKYYLGEENLQMEVSSLFSKEKEYQSFVKDYQDQLTKFSKYSAGEVKTLYQETDVMMIRLILVLLARNVSAGEIERELVKYKLKQESKFDDWFHNNKIGLIFLLCKEQRRKKLYYGYNTYISLSSSIIRYFIELCEVAFRNASRNGFTFDTPCPIDVNEQSEAARYVSQYKLNDVETYAPFSSETRQFTGLIGRIFEKLHRNPKLSEPEQNHFSTDYEALSHSARAFLSNAVLYSVLQKRAETKDKSTQVDSNKWEFHLNHIYTPYFEISPRRIRKLHIKPHVFEALISGDLAKAQLAANSLVDGRDKAPDVGQLSIQDLF